MEEGRVGRIRMRSNYYLIISNNNNINDDDDDNDDEGRWVVVKEEWGREGVEGEETYYGRVGCRQA